MAMVRWKFFSIGSVTIVGLAGQLALMACGTGPIEGFPVLDASSSGSSPSDDSSVISGSDVGTAGSSGETASSGSATSGTAPASGTSSGGSSGRPSSGSSDAGAYVVNKCGSTPCDLRFEDVLSPGRRRARRLVLRARKPNELRREQRDVPLPFVARLPDERQHMLRSLRSSNEDRRHGLPNVVHWPSVLQSGFRVFQRRNVRYAVVHGHFHLCIFAVSRKKRRTTARPCDREIRVNVQPVDSTSWIARLGRDRPRSAAVLVALAGLALLPALFAPFLADDYFHVVVAERLGVALTRGWVLPIDLGGAWWTPHGLAVEYFRPMIVLSFAIDRLVYGLHAAGYHLTNLGLHAAATLLTWAIARRILGAGFGAFAAAALFAMHPCHVQAVGWISGRTDVLATLFYMGAFLLYLESRERPRWAALLVGLSLVIFLLALLAKEMAITFPAILLGHNLLRPERESLARRLVAPALASVVAGLYVALRVTSLGGFHTPPTPFAFHLGDPDFVRHITTAPLVYLGALTLFVPADPMVTVPFWKAHPVLFVLFAGLVLSTFFAVLRQVRNRNALAWGLGWMGVTFLPVALLTVGEHFLYLPSVGYCILVGSQWPERMIDVEARTQRGLGVLAAIVMVVCMGRTVILSGVAAASWKPWRKQRRRSMPPRTRSSSS